MPTLIAAAPKNKSFSFSYSKLKGFEVCPRRYNEVDVKKAWPEPRSEQLAWGDEVHLAMAKALKTGTELPLQFAMYQPWVDKTVRTKGSLLVEDQCKWAITREFKPTAWFGQNVWCRSMADAVKLDGIAALIVDWKTGKSQNVDEVQLILCSLVAFLQFPKIQRIRADFVWLQEDTQTTMVIDRHEAADQWAEIIPRVERLEQATLENNFPPTPNNFCRSYCPVKSCEYNGK
jgi:hypothetical protein